MTLSVKLVSAVKHHHTKLISLSGNISKTLSRWQYHYDFKKDSQCKLNERKGELSSERKSILNQQMFV